MPEKFGEGERKQHTQDTAHGFLAKLLAIAQKILQNRLLPRGKRIKEKKKSHGLRAEEVKALTVLHAPRILEKNKRSRLHSCLCDNLHRDV